MAAIFSPSMTRSASNVSLAVTSVPFSMSVRMWTSTEAVFGETSSARPRCRWRSRRGSRPGSRQLLDHVLVRVGPAVAIELPDAAHLLDHVEVQIRGDQLVLVLAGLGEEVPARIDEVRVPVELADVPRRLGPDAVDAAHEVAVGHRVRGLL